MTTPQHRCVFVGNIPYDATEEQLVQICEEVGPVVSFRLVVDRETGKPKGYGFCEYRDEETAASARRNLQGYEINGRQLRVDYAENDKGVDRNREQGRGGPGLASNFDSQKSSVGPAISGDPSFNQPIGLTVAAAAASVMAGILGEPQTSVIDQNQNAIQGQTNVGGNDPLTLHLAGMSRNQLCEFLNEMKALAQQNQQQARHILLLHPQLPKAIFQAQIMLGVVTPQMLPNFRPDPSIQSGQQEQMRLAQNQIQPGKQTQMQAGQHSQVQLLQQSQSQNIPMQQLMQPPPVQSSIQVIQPTQPQVPQTILQSLQSASQSLNLPVQPPMQSPPRTVQSQVPPLLSGQPQQPSNQPSLGSLHQPPLPQQPRPLLQSLPPAGQVQNQPTQNMAFKPSSVSHQLPSQAPFQSGNHPQNTLAIPFQKHNQPPLRNLPPPQQSYQMGSGSTVGTALHVGSDATHSSTGPSNYPSNAGLINLGIEGALQLGRGPNLIQGLGGVPDVSWSQFPQSAGGACGDLATVASTSAGLPIIEDGSKVYTAAGSGNGGIASRSSDSGVGTSLVHSQGPSQTSVEGMSQLQQPASHGPPLTQEEEIALLQQVKSLTPEQINALSPEQQQQVLMLQQMILTHGVPY